MLVTVGREMLYANIYYLEVIPRGKDGLKEWLLNYLWEKWT